MLHSCMDYLHTHSWHPIHRTSPPCLPDSHNDNRPHPQGRTRHHIGKDLSHNLNQRTHSSCRSSLYDTRTSVPPHGHCTFLRSGTESCHRSWLSSHSGAPWSHVYSYIHNCSQAEHSPASPAMSTGLTSTRWCLPHSVDPQNPVGSGIQTPRHGQCRSHCCDTLRAHNHPRWSHTVCPTFLCNRNKLHQLARHCTENTSKQE